MGLFDKVKALFQSEKLDVSTRFEFLREAVSGTMSKFHMVREISTGKTVGLKILDPEKTLAFESRFKTLKKPSEGEIAAAIKHPNIVETYEYGTTVDDQQYILMEFVEGSGLHVLIHNQDPEFQGHRLSLIVQMAEAIEAVHQAGYIHRDVCPRNFICGADYESVKLIDFGLTLPDTKDFHQPGNRTGTPLYMAPEIVRRRWTDKRVDLFALGVTAYRLCTFEMPWPASDMTGRAALAHDTQQPVDITRVRPTIDKTLAEAIMRCLSAKPDGRPESAQEFANRLRRLEKIDGA